jgi:hypothetical protein
MYVILQFILRYKCANYKLNSWRLFPGAVEVQAGAIEAHPGETSDHRISLLEAI